MILMHVPMKKPSIRTGFVYDNFILGWVFNRSKNSEDENQPWCQYRFFFGFFHITFEWGF